MYWINSPQIVKNLKILSYENFTTFKNMWNTQLKPLYYYCKTKEGIIILETAIALQGLSKKKMRKKFQILIAS